LFDLEKDPHEMVSVYGKPDYVSVVRLMKVELVSLKVEYKVPSVQS